MDKYNVIDITTDLDELNQDMYKWSSMPYERRLRADDECKRRYGISNTTLYNRLKAAILSSKTLDDPEYIGNTISEGFNVDDKLPDMPDYSAFLEDKWRMEIAMQLNDSPVIAIVYNPTYIFSKEEALELVNDLYKKYSLLSEKNKRFSNSYSMDLFGYNVPNMYEIVSNKLSTDIDNSKHDKLLCMGESVTDVIAPVKESVDEYIIGDNKIELLRVKLDSCNENMRGQDRAYYNRLNSVIDENLEYNYEDIFNKCIPIRVPSSGVIECHDIPASKINSSNYYSILKEKMDKFNSTTNEEEKAILEQDILDLGWNPVLQVSNMSFGIARHHMNLYYKNKGCNIIDISNFKVDTTVNESTSKMRKLYKEKNLYPIYIVLSYTDTLMGHIIRNVKGSMFTHAGISLDSDLSYISTFNFNNINDKGYCIDSLEFYKSKSPNALVSVMCLFVDKSVKDYLEKTFNYFKDIKNRTSYSISNLFNILFNKAIPNNPSSVSLVCSQFVDTVLKMCNINLFGDKTSNLVLPQDFEEIKNPKVYKVYEGLASKYNEKHVENLINTLFSSRDKSYIKYSDMMNNLSESLSVYNFDCITENSNANLVLEYINDLLTPNAVIYERKSIIKITDDGNVSIQLLKDLEREYQEAHRLLTTYSSDNLEGIKHELARLFHVINICEKKIKRMKKDDSKYKDMINLRSRCMNDFKKYLKIVLEKEPNFDFTAYYRDSEYDDSTIEIDRKLIDLIAELVSKIIKKKK